MRKLSLDLNDLAVESFATDAAPADRGTVDAHALLPEAPTGKRDCLEATWGTGSTCDGDYTCGVCAATGWESCDLVCEPTWDCVSAAVACIP